MTKNKRYDIIVVGGGHAGCEAALAASKMGLRTLLLTMNKNTIGKMSCNPAIGGIGKGHLVKEIDALGGELAKAADFGGIQFRQLNASKGAAARSSRAQEDRKRFKSYVQRVITGQKNLSLCEDIAENLIVENGVTRGVIAKKNKRIVAKAVIITVGTFMNGLIHVGLKNFPGGRIDEDSSDKMSRALEGLGLKLMRFKTGTCARLDGRTIDFSGLDIQEGDKTPIPFSYSTKNVIKKQVPCHITYTNKKTHEIIRSGLNMSPLYTGIIKSTGVRYCPSIEDKIVKFPDRVRHQVFLEPEGLDTFEYYPNGLATSLPEDIQIKFLHSIKGLEKVKVTKFGYGIEYDLIDPTQLFPTLESKNLSGLFFAGQINGTTGYEEAAAQGLIAGLNAVQRVKGKNPLILDRSTSYIGVLIDDLVTKGTNEPYRMFTSRVEYRLLLREDNADTRLRKIGYSIGLVKKREYRGTEQVIKRLTEIITHLKNARIRPSEKLNNLLMEKGISSVRRNISIYEALKRPGLNIELLRKSDLLKIDIPDFLVRRVENEIKYEGYIKKQLQEVKKFKNLEKIKIPSSLNYNSISGLSNEIKEKLNRVRPVCLGQASRISGVTPVAISVLMVHLKTKDRR